MDVGNISLDFETKFRLPASRNMATCRSASYRIAKCPRCTGIGGIATISPILPEMGHPECGLKEPQLEKTHNFTSILFGELPTKQSKPLVSAVSVSCTQPVVGGRAMRNLMLSAGLILLAVGLLWLFTPIFEPLKELLNPPPSSSTRGGAEAINPDAVMYWNLINTGLTALNAVFAGVGAYLTYLGLGSSRKA